MFKEATNNNGQLEQYRTQASPGASAALKPAVSSSWHDRGVARQHGGGCGQTVGDPTGKSGDLGQGVKGVAGSKGMDVVEGRGWEEKDKINGGMGNLKLYQKSVTSKSHNSLNSIFKMNLKSPQVISVEGSGHRLKGSLVESNKHSGSLTKVKNLGGKFQNMASEANGDQFYNKIKVVEVNSVLDDLKDESTCYGQSRLRSEPQFNSNTQNNTFGGSGILKKSLLGTSNDVHIGKTRIVLSSVEECLIQMHQLMNRHGIFDKSVSENTSEVYNQSNSGQLQDCLSKLQQHHQTLQQHFQFNHQSVLALEGQIKESTDVVTDLSRRLEEMTGRCQVSQKELEKLEKDDERHRYKIQQLNIKLKQTQQESKAKIMEVTQTLMEHRLTAKDDSPFVCVNCGTVNYPEESSNDESANLNSKTQEIVNIQSKYSSMIKQKQARIIELEEQLITCQNLLDEERQDNYQQQHKVITQNKKLSAENHVLKSDREKYQAQKDKLLYENNELSEQYENLKALYDRLMEENAQLIEWRAMQRNQEFVHNQQYLNQSAQFANSSENELASRHFRMNSQFQSIVNKLPSLIQCSQSSRQEQYRSPDMQTRYEAINRSQISPPKRQSLTNAGGGPPKEHPSPPSLMQPRSPAKKCNTIGILQEQEGGVTSQVYKTMAASKGALYASHVPNCIIEEDDAETRKGGSGGSKNEGRLFDLQQIHLFQFNQKNESPPFNPDATNVENQQQRAKQNQAYQSMMQSEYLDSSNNQYYREQSLRCRLNASYISKQGSTDLVDILNGYSMPRSHSCKSTTQYVTQNSKLSPSVAKSREQNSKSADSPFKMTKIESNHNDAGNAANDNGADGGLKDGNLNKNNLAFQKAMTFVNQAEIEPDPNYKDYGDNNYNNRNKQNEGNNQQVNQWEAARNFYRDSYKQWRESIDNQSLKKVIFHGQSPNTMLKITSKVHKLAESSAQQSPSPSQDKLNHIEMLSKSKRLVSNLSDPDNDKHNQIENRSDTSPVRIRQSIQNLVLTDQKSIHSKNSQKKTNVMGGGSFNMQANGFGYTNAKAQRVGREDNENESSKFKEDDPDDGFTNDINNLQIDIQNRINFAIMKIDQMNLTQDMQSTVHNRSRFEDRSNSQLLLNHPLEHTNNILDLTLEKSQNNILEALNNNNNNYPEFTPQNKYALDRRFTEINDRFCDTGRTNMSHMTANTQKQVIENSNFIRNTLLQLRQLVNERLEEERKRKEDIGLQQRFIHKRVNGASLGQGAPAGFDCQQSQKSHSLVVDGDRLRRTTLGLETSAANNNCAKGANGGDQHAKNHYATNYKKEKKASKSNANYQKFLNNLHQDEKRWQRYVDVINNQMTIDPNALKNKYMQKEQKEQDTSLYIHRHIEDQEQQPAQNKKRHDVGGQNEKKAAKGRVSGLFEMEANNMKQQIASVNLAGGKTDRTNRSKNQPIIKKKQLNNIMHLQKKYEQAKEKVANDKLRDNIHRRRQILENQQHGRDDTSPKPMVGPAIVNTERQRNSNREFLEMQKQVKQTQKINSNNVLFFK